MTNQPTEAQLRIVGEQIVETVFILTRLRCAQAVEQAQELIKASSILAKTPEIEAYIVGLLDGVAVKVCEVLLEQATIDEAVNKLSALSDQPRVQPTHD